MIARRGPPRILVIRRDNIGDLVCTTPLISALRERYPLGRIAVLVNTYNSAVVTGNPDIDAVYAYEKGKHRGTRSIVSVYAQRLRMAIAMRGEKFEYAILATPGFAGHALRHARLVGARHVLGYTEPGREHSGLDIALPYDRAARTHEVEQVFALLKALGIDGPPPAARVYPDPGERSAVEEAVSGLPGAAPIVGVHISARRIKQQWPSGNYAALIRAIAGRYGVRILLLWAPGAPDNPMHPGDDDKAREIARQCPEVPLLAYPTPTLPRLIAALSVCDRVVCPDGGAMHLAAGLGKPILCFFGDSPPERWRPWKTAHELLQPQSRDLRDLSVEKAFEGFERLLRAQPGV